MVDTQRHPLAPVGKLDLTIDMEGLASISMAELRVLASAVNTLVDVGSGLINQPRFTNSATDRNNHAGNRLDEILDWLLTLVQAIANVADEAKPQDLREVEDRFWTVLAYEADCGDSIARICSISGAAALAHEEAKQAERRAAFEERP
ncbi:hypothetical protein [Terrihabitans sp. B22-R8]|uniref:hypothetical protein n=1 Tax=Terrihabitans sp. B22-R8 TaxID=3425128 RepID=UPI00403CAAFD